LGDALNGWDAEGHCCSWDEVTQFLRDAAIKAYPDSSFAKNAPASSQRTY
jgi:hypothetical protein